MSLPNPGSTVARTQGCKCPMIDNQYGLGAYMDMKGTPHYIIDPKCPMHGDKRNDH